MAPLCGVFGTTSHYRLRTINAVMAAPVATELGTRCDDLACSRQVYIPASALPQIQARHPPRRSGPRGSERVVWCGAGIRVVSGVVGPFVDVLVGRALIGLGVCLAMTAG